VNQNAVTHQEGTNGEPQEEYGARPDKALGAYDATTADLDPPLGTLDKVGNFTS
jgi:hypothetical protein